MSYSYKPVFLLAFLSNMSKSGEVKLTDIADAFADYYSKRKEKGLLIEKKQCLFTKDSYTLKDVEKLILNMPFKRFEDMGYMHHSKYLGLLQIDKSIMKNLDNNDISNLYTCCSEALEKYWKH